MSSVPLTCDTQNENKINRLTFVVRGALKNSHSSGLKQWPLLWDRCETQAILGEFVFLLRNTNSPKIACVGGYSYT